MRGNNNFKTSGSPETELLHLAIVFKSLILAGFEGSTGYNLQHQWIDQVKATQHDQFVDEDYRRLRDTGILAARESVRWPLIDRYGHYNFTSIRPFIEASQKYEIEVIYDLFHFGYPDYINLFEKSFPRQFADYCHAAATYISQNSSGPYYFTPINEPSFLSWAAGEMGLFAPHANGRGKELKFCLIQAAIEGINAIWAACPTARIINVDPLCRVTAPDDRPDLQAEAELFNSNIVFESWDMLSGKLCPELGGSPRHLDIIGINYYWTNQWDLSTSPIPLDDQAPCRWSLRQLVRSVWERYGQEIVITETAHKDDMRPSWIQEMAMEVEAILDEDISLRGVCLYPILSMPEWHAQSEWTHMGLWDLKNVDGVLERELCQPMMEALNKTGILEKQIGTRAGAYPEDKLHERKSLEAAKRV